VIQPQAQGFGNWRQRIAQRHDPTVTQNVPTVPHFPDNRHTLLRLNRVHDWAALEQELCQRLHVQDHQSDPFQGQKISKQDRALVEKLTDSKLLVATLEDIVDDQHCIVSLARGQIVWYAPLLSIVDRSLLRPNAEVLVSLFGFAVVGVLDDVTSNEATNLIVESSPLETFADIGT
jgi:26S proteasome regulatory subunit T2